MRPRPMRARTVAVRLERVHRRPYRVDAQLKTRVVIPTVRASRDRIKAKYKVVRPTACLPNSAWNRAEAVPRNPAAVVPTSARSRNSGAPLCLGRDVFRYVAGRARLVEASWTIGHADCTIPRVADLAERHVEEPRKGCAAEDDARPPVGIAERPCRRLARRRASHAEITVIRSSRLVSPIARAAIARVIAPGRKTNPPRSSRTTCHSPPRTGSATESSPRSQSRREPEIHTRSTGSRAPMPRRLCSQADPLRSNRDPKRSIPGRQVDLVSRSPARASPSRLWGRSKGFPPRWMCGENPANSNRVPVSVPQSPAADSGAPGHSAGRRVLGLDPTINHNAGGCPDCCR